MFGPVAGQLIEVGQRLGWIDGDGRGKPRNFRSWRLRPVIANLDRPPAEPRRRFGQQWVQPVLQPLAGAVTAGVDGQGVSLFVGSRRAKKLIELLAGKLIL